MRQFPAPLFVVVLSAGCSWIYNPNGLDNPADAKVFRDATEIDAPVDAPLVRDADPSMLTLIDVEPNVIYGGQGSDNSRPATLVIHGHNFVDGFTVDIEPSTGLHVLGTPTRSFDGDYIAVEVEADVMSGSATSNVPLTLTVTEPGAPAEMLSTLTLTNLPTLETAALDYAKLAATTYARIKITSGTITFDDPADAERIELRSISSVTITPPITAVGGAGGSSPGAAGPGGCAGGGIGATGGCPSVPGGGDGATGTAGGGGGGYAQMGTAGGGGIAGGAAHGNSGILNYDSDGAGHSQNQSSGGGGGAAGGLLTSGVGLGGGGGGEVEIIAGGTIALGGIDVGGGNGGAGSNGVVSAAGGGGGGAGGVIVIRSDAGDLAVTGTLSALGGGGGSGGTALGTTGGVGGPGSPGRIRADVPTSPPTSSGSPAHRNPIFDAATPTIVTTVNPMVKLVGTVGEMFDLTQYDFDNTNHNGEPKNVMFGPENTVTVQVSLRNGYNRLCATLHDGVPGMPLADTCIVIVFLP